MTERREHQTGLDITRINTATAAVSTTYMKSFAVLMSLLELLHLIPLCFVNDKSFYLAIISPFSFFFL